MQTQELLFKNAKAILAHGSPRRADVRAARNHRYLACRGLASALNTPERDEATRATLDKHYAFQDALRTVQRLGYLFNQRPRYKRQQRPA